MKRTMIAATLALGAIALAGCGEPPAKSDKAQSPSSSRGADYAEVPVKLSDGRTVLCLQYMNGYDAFSCDWEHTK